MEERKSLPHSAYTAFEIRLSGGSEWADGARVGKLHVPLGVTWDTPGFTLDEARVLREVQKYFYSLPARVFTNPNAVLSLEPLNDDGETVNDPQVLLRDPETGSLTPSPELTKALYEKLREFDSEEARELQEMGSEIPEWYFPQYREGTQCENYSPGKERE